MRAAMQYLRAVLREQNLKCFVRRALERLCIAVIVAHRIRRIESRARHALPRQTEVSRMRTLRPKELRKQVCMRPFGRHAVRRADRLIYLNASEPRNEHAMRAPARNFVYEIV